MTAAEWEAYADASACGDVVTCLELAAREDARKWGTDGESHSCHGSDVPMRHRDKRADSRKVERLAARSEANAQRRGLARMVTAGWM